MGGKSALTTGYTQSTAKVLKNRLNDLSSKLGKDDMVVSVKGKQTSLRARINELKRAMNSPPSNIDEFKSEINGYISKVSQRKFSNCKH